MGDTDDDPCLDLFICAPRTRPITDALVFFYISFSWYIFNLDGKGRPFFFFVACPAFACVFGASRSRTEREEDVLDRDYSGLSG